MVQDGSTVEDEPTIRAVVDSIDDTSDRKEWEACRELFADSVHIDFGSLTGGAPSSLPADVLIAGWRENLHEAKRTFHLRSHHRIEIDGDSAVCVSHGYAPERARTTCGRPGAGIRTHCAALPADGGAPA